jgi:glutamyl/glutaminyl-tRNA synthetase
METKMQKIDQWLTLVDPKQPFRSRLAPTPSGYLHLGNAFNFILTALLVKLSKGELFLRIDDHDYSRCRAEYIDDIFLSLNWLQISYQTKTHFSPQNAQDFRQNCSQQLRFEKYKNIIQKILVPKNLVYSCLCSRKSVTKYPHHFCDCLKNEIPLFTPGANLKINLSHSPIILWRKDEIPAYHLVSLIDDFQQGINLVVRGEDLRESSEIQGQLDQALNLNYWSSVKVLHHPLVQKDQQKLSKSAGAQALKSIKKAHSNSAIIYQSFSDFFGLEKQFISFDELYAFYQLKDSYLNYE